ncbi:16S rRNA (guanine(966)-N(2))-methyltransferase RsmD [Cysteiniphilum sp. QT6929]|uniref:16S rRNA (guanine(966)-N(2))-methyltransferase RsmD n=1 Tax=Cysteiniphilum sp. QT6929 TaxID=2975055 RepID=UPI0024B3B414|nr:16S rRNA (guanine(966)-N(2))-methyltransferase RsmD [Cysteiniphilum sp. QT6929]WHN65575.1 16S rRNA (guanine(966)-N(2))-methyltransferase RsmD [Cysteiniphilum sp. QT6929]
MCPLSKTHTSKAPLSKVRIIAGKYKSRQIEFSGANNSTLRPTSDRLRETLFNWLMPYVVDTDCLDAFAGSGTLGFEVLSRLAKSCDFFELDAQAIKHLNSNKNKLNIENATIYQRDVLTHLKTCDNYDVIFLDPPFSSDLLEQSLSSILHNVNIDNDCVIYAEYATNNPPPSLSHFTMLKQTKQGAVSACLLQKS